MRKNKFLYILLFSFSFLFSGCSDDDNNDEFDLESWRIENERFFNSLATQQGLQKIEAGSGEGFLYYKVLEQGGSNGESPAYTSTVYVRYIGATLDGFDEATQTIIEGKEFDSSDNDQNIIGPGPEYKPSELKVSNLIEGWREALQRMVPGDKWQLYIPSELGYGSAGSGTTIHGYSVLIFEVELVQVK